FLELFSLSTLSTIPSAYSAEEAREVHKRSAFAQKIHGVKAKRYNKQRHNEKIQMKKTCVPFLNARFICRFAGSFVDGFFVASPIFTIKMHEEKGAKQKDADAVPKGAVPAYLLDREGQQSAK
ncbi:MAG: hypothetical protein BJ554DRAFT_6748, partial [Olpidium bornovanus]